MTTIITHSSKFHVDDIFAVAALTLFLEKNNNDKVSVIRSRDLRVIETGDFVVDVGGVYDPEKNRFDHHQEGGAGVGLNNIPYSSFGLVWKHYGEKICGNLDVANAINKTLVQPIDAHDNGVEIVKETFADLYPYNLNQLKYILLPTWKEDTDFDEIFMKAVSYAKWILSRQIKVASDEFEGRDLVLAAYKNAKDKRVIELDERLPWKEVLAKFPEPLFVIYPKMVDGTWSVKTVSIDENGLGLLEFVPRKSFPDAWAGKSGSELQNITGVDGAIFSHRNHFLTVVKTREDALKITELVLNK